LGKLTEGIPIEGAVEKIKEFMKTLREKYEIEKT